MTDYKLGIHLFGDADKHPLPEQVAMIARAGFDGLTMKWDPDRTDEVAEAAARHSLYFQSLHAPFGQVRAMWDEGEAGEAMQARLLACLDDCAAHGIPVMVIHAFIGFGMPYIPTQIGLDRFGHVIEYAAKKGVRLAFENVEGEEYLDAIMATYGHLDHVGFCLDTGHKMCYNHNRDFLSQYGHKLFHTHLNDNLGQKHFPMSPRDDLHLTMGDGAIDWPTVMADIRRTGYRDMLVCELSMANKPEGHELDRYAAMSLEEFYTYALAAAKRLLTL